MASAMLQTLNTTALNLGRYSPVPSDCSNVAIQPMNKVSAMVNCITPNSTKTRNSDMPPQIEGRLIAQARRRDGHPHVTDIAGRVRNRPMRELLQENAGSHRDDKKAVESCLKRHRGGVIRRHVIRHFRTQRVCGSFRIMYRTKFRFSVER
jgi:hypothetical protein